MPNNVKAILQGQNLNKLPNKTITLAEYNALTEAQKNAEVIYHIVDDSNGGAVYTKTQTDTLLAAKVPVYGRGVNLLDNWYFVGGGSQQGGEQFPINQRGQTSYIANGYGIDRWFSTNTHLTVTLLADGIQLASDGSGNAFLRQNVQNINATDSYTLSMLAQGVSSGRLRFDKNDPTEGTGVEAQFDSSDGTNPFLVTCTGVIGANNFAVPTIRIDSGKSIKVLAVKMELGDTQTLAHQDAGGDWVLNDPPPNFATELMKCLRYCYALPHFMRVRAAVVYPDYIDFSIPLAIPMMVDASKPVIIGDANIAVQGITGGAVSGFTFELINTHRASTYNTAPILMLRARKTAHGLTDACLTVTDVGCLISSE